MPSTAVRAASELLFAPAEKLQVVLDRMIAEPVDELVIGDARLAHRRPDLDDPREHAEVLVDPVERAADHRFRVIAELVIDGDRRIAGQLGALAPGRLVEPEILGVHLVVEIWSPMREAGITDYKFIDWFRDHPIEDDLKLFRWSEEKLEGRAHRPWKAFEHPQLGKVEIGGWDRFHAFGNPPLPLLDRG